MTDGFDEPAGDNFNVDAELRDLGLGYDELDGALEKVAASPGQAGALGQMWDPPAGFVDRVTNGTIKRMADRDALFAVADLFGLGVHVTRSLIEEPGDTAHES